jgi:putative phosphoribosyl transferase
MNGTPFYRDRQEAGQKLAEALRDRDVQPDPLVMALPRGGVPIGKTIADALDAEFDVMLVRKLGHPNQPELAMGAIASGGGRSLNERVVSTVSDEQFQRVEQKEREELERREKVFRGDRPQPRVEGRCVILVDDGIATGSTMRAAAQALRSLGPKRIVAAVPVGPPSSIADLEQVTDEVVCPNQPEPFMSIGQFYRDFTQLSDDDVKAVLQASRSGTD